MEFERADLIEGAPFRSEDALDGAEALHAACGIYTRPSIAAAILDSVGWSANCDLADCRLLEPAAGDGAFVIDAVKRLLRSFEIHDRALHLNLLSDRILAFEIHAGEAEKCRAAVIQQLLEKGLKPKDARTLGAHWIRTADFLLSPLESGVFTHVVGNPPYLRWSKLPPHLRLRYEKVLPATAAKGDLFLPFLDRGIESLRKHGKLGFVCTDRWKFMGFAEGFRQTRLRDVDVLSEEAIAPAKAYMKPAATYPTMFVMRRRAKPKAPAPPARNRWTLKEAGFDVRVGPALGCTEAFVLSNEFAHEVEVELLRPWLSPSDVQESSVKQASKMIICLHDQRGILRNIDEFPKAKAWLLRYRAKLEKRSVVVKQGAAWYRPIDKVVAKTWEKPKLLVPELSRIPRVALDETGAVPAHGLYVIQARTPSADISHLFERLSEGRLSKEIEKISPKTSGGYLRCYKRFLQEIALV